MPRTTPCSFFCASRGTQLVAAFVFDATGAFGLFAAVRPTALRWAGLTLAAAAAVAFQLAPVGYVAVAPALGDGPDGPGDGLGDGLGDGGSDGAPPAGGDSLASEYTFVSVDSTADGASERSTRSSGRPSPGRPPPGSFSLQGKAAAACSAAPAPR